MTGPSSRSRVVGFTVLSLQKDYYPKYRCRMLSEITNSCPLFQLSQPIVNGRCKCPWRTAALPQVTFLPCREGCTKKNVPIFEKGLQGEYREPSDRCVRLRIWLEVVPLTLVVLPESGQSWTGTSTPTRVSKDLRTRVTSLPVVLFSLPPPLFVVKGFDDGHKNVSI